MEPLSIRSSDSRVMTTDRSVSRDALEDAFELPPSVASDPRLSALYNEVVANLRREARGIPMNTVQTLLLERIAYYYVTLKSAEWNGSVTPLQLKDLTKFWLDMTTEFNKQLASGHEKLRDALLLSISEMVMQAITTTVTNGDDRKNLVMAIQEGFAEMGL